MLRWNQFTRNLDTTSGRTIIVLMVLLVVLSAMFFGSVAGQNEKMALYAVISVTVFVFAIANTDFALSVLILSMLLSPEFAFGSAGGVGQMSQRSVVIRLDDLFLALITFSWLAKIAINKELGLLVRTEMNRPVFIYLGVSLLATFLGMFSGTVKPLIGLLYNIKYFQYFLVFLMVVSHIKDLKTMNRFLRVLLLTAVVVSIYAVAQIPSGVRVSAPFEGEGGEANTLGGYLVIMMSIVIGMMTTEKRFFRQIRNIMMIVLMLIPFAYTLSRSSWMAMFPALMAFAVYSPKRRYIIVGMVLMVIALPVLLPSAVYERINYTFAMENTLRDDVVTVGHTALDPSTSARILSWKSTLVQWTERPVFGWGVTGAGFKDAQFFRVLVETGVAGFVAFGWMLFRLHRIAAKRLKMIDGEKYPKYQALVIAYIAGYWGMLLHAVGANTFIIVRIMEPFWFLTALVYILPNLLEEAEKKSEGKDMVLL